MLKTDKSQDLNQFDIKPPTLNPMVVDVCFAENEKIFHRQHNYFADKL